METQFRPYSMVLQIADATASGVSLKDTAGSGLHCNFISVEASGENPDAYYRAAISPAGITTPVTGAKTAALSLGHDASGIVGGYASVNKGVVEFLLHDKDRANGITLQLSEAGATNFFITYGQIQSGNILRDNERPIGD
tara:strand:- start:1089 stop:1508 length:420 start_codon:yes stop_codon:yes gene_type:complete